MHFITMLVVMVIFGMHLFYAQEATPKNYEVVFDDLFYEAEDFTKGLAIVVKEKGISYECKVINRKGQTIMHINRGGQVVDDIKDAYTVRHIADCLKEYSKSPGKIRRFIDEGYWIFVDRDGNIISRIPCPDGRDDREYALIDWEEFEARYKNLLYPVKSNTKPSKWGYRDLENKMVIDFQFDRAKPFSEGMAAVKKDKKWGFINQEGIFTINPLYEQAENFVGELAAVRKDKAWGLINKEGTVVADFQYKKIDSIGNGLIPVRMRREWGFLDAQGRVVAKCQYEEIDDPSEGMVPVKLNKKWGCLDELGRLAVECQYEEIEAFSDGKAKARKGKNWGVIDRSGRVIIPFEYGYLGEFSDGMIVFTNLVPVAFSGPIRYGFLNSQGQVIVEPKYQAVTSYYQGIAEVMDDDENLGLVDKEGNMVLDCLYSFIGISFDDIWFQEMIHYPNRPFLDGGIYDQFVLMDGYGLEEFLEDTNTDHIKKMKLLTGVTRNSYSPLIPVLPNDKKWGFVDYDGNIVIECIYDEVKPFCEGLAAVKVNGKWGYINDRGRVVIPIQYANADSFSEGLAAVNMVQDRLFKRYGFINKEGKLVIGHEFTDVGRFSEGLARVTLKGEKFSLSENIWGYIRLKKN